MSDDVLSWVKNNRWLLINICKRFLQVEDDAHKEMVKLTGRTPMEVLYGSLGLPPEEGDTHIKRRDDNIRKFIELLENY